MLVVQFSNYGGYEMLQAVEKGIPVLADGQLLVRVTLAAVNPVDDTLRKGMIKASQLPMIPGNEAVGVVEKGNAEFPEGTRVIVSCFNTVGQVRGIYTTGAWQQYLALSPSELIKIPEGVTDEVAAAFPVGYFSARACLNKAEFAAGKRVLALGVGGSVGNAAVQIARAEGASLVITTAGSSEKVAVAKSYGFDNVIDLSKETISEGVARITNSGGVDIVIDSIGGNLTGDAIHSLSRNGIIVVIGYSAGATFNANITDFVWKGLQMRGQSLNGWFNKTEEIQVWNQLLPLLSAEKINPVVSKVFPAQQAADAQRYLIEERPFGKVLINFNA